MSTNNINKIKLQIDIFITNEDCMKTMTLV